MPASTKINYTSASYKAPTNNMTKQGYITYEVRPIGYKDSLERIVLVSCQASRCTKTWDIKASHATSTGNFWNHIQTKHPYWLSGSTGTSSNQSITSFTSNRDPSISTKDGLERRVILFLVKNNISINAICSKSFKELINYEKA